MALPTRRFFRGRCCNLWEGCRARGRSDASRGGILLSLDDRSVSRACAEALTRQAPSRLQNNLAADPLLSHEHIQSVTILPDHGVLDRRTGRINLETGHAGSNRGKPI